MSTSSTLFLLAVYGAGLYALVSGATLFATEHETGTYEFQRILPCSGGRLLTGKLMFSLVSLLAFVATLFLSAFLFTGGHQLPQTDLCWYGTPR